MPRQSWETRIFILNHTVLDSVLLDVSTVPTTIYSCVTTTSTHKCIICGFHIKYSCIQVCRYLCIHGPLDTGNYSS